MRRPAAVFSARRAISPFRGWLPFYKLKVNGETEERGEREEGRERSRMINETNASLSLLRSSIEEEREGGEGLIIG